MSANARAQHGILLVTAAMACFSALDTVSKVIGAAVPVVLAMAMRFLFQAVVTGSVLLPQRGRALLRTRHPVLQFVRGLLLLLAGSTVSWAKLSGVPPGLQSVKHIGTIRRKQVQDGLSAAVSINYRPTRDPHDYQ